jgi:hypothetical protein
MTKSTHMRVWGWSFLVMSAVLAFNDAPDVAINFVILACISFLHADVVEGRTR